MQIQVNRLREVLSLLKPVVPRNPTLKTLTNILLTDGKAVATNLETMVIVAVPESDETMLLPFQDLTKILDYVPGDAMLKVQSDDDTINLSWNGGEDSSSFPISDPKEWPSLPTFEAVTEADIDGDALIAALTTAVTYVAKDETRPVLNGVSVVFGSPMEVAAGDGFRMAHQVLPLEFPSNTTSIIPSGSVAVLLHLWKRTPRTPPRSDTLIPVLISKKKIHVAFDSEKRLQIGFGETATAIIKPTSGKAPAWLKLIPKGKPVMQVKVFAPEFEAAVRRVQDVANKGAGIVKMEFNEGSVRVSANHEKLSVSAGIAALDMEGDPTRAAVNAKYLLGFLKGKDGLVSISMTAEDAPLSFQHSHSPRVIIMPMRADWGDGSPVPEAEAEAEPAAAAVAEPPGEESAQSEPEKEPAKAKKKKAAKAAKS